MLDPGIGYLIVAAFALLFAQAALHKLRGRAEFGGVLGAYRILPAPLVPLAAVAVPALEATLAVLLLVDAARPAAARVAAGLLLAYAAAIALNLYRGRRDLDCGCGGPNERRPIAAWMLARNALLAALLLVASLPWAARPLVPTDALTLAGGLAVLALLYTAADRLLGEVMPRTAALRGAR